MASGRGPISSDDLGLNNLPCQDGVASPEDIDTAVSQGLGLRWSFMGPFETIDLNANGVFVGSRTLLIIND